MPISGLVLTIDHEQPDSLRQVVAALAERPEVTVGESFGCKLAIATDTERAEVDRGLRAWIEALPQVVHVDVTFIAFDSDMEVAR
ncbi:MAG: hypothetical protein KatS3mg111_3596 [Pirellulaceae bacterium]|nr:MAG: hypothetical protein KatS3mg111_3596 [Pirellulaceae bacterium]